MSRTTWPGKQIWPIWQKIIFRFFFIYFVIYANPIFWIIDIPGSERVLKYYYQFMEWCLNIANDKIFHLYKTIPSYGGGDTPSGWVQLCLFLLIAFTGCVIWSLLDTKRVQYNRLAYWFRIILRYTLIMNCFGYGFNKLFLWQMPFPSISQLSSAFGDYSPMRLSWLYMGSSSTYQVFAGALELFAGILLLFRRTAPFGTIVALGVFTNVMMTNLGYDIVVKSFSIHLVIISLILLAFEYKRIIAIVFNMTMPPGNLYSVRFSKQWLRNTAFIAKLGMIVLIIYPLTEYYSGFIENRQPKVSGPIKPGVYEVKTFVLNKDTIPFTYSDSLRWKDIIFDNNFEGSVGTTDTMFRQRYGRGYFKFTIDSITKNINIIKRTNNFKPVPLGKMFFEISDSNTIVLSGILRKNTLYVVLRRTNRHFQLAEKQFHWLSEFAR